MKTKLAVSALLFTAVAVYSYLNLSGEPVLSPKIKSGSTLTAPVVVRDKTQAQAFRLPSAIAVTVPYDPEIKVAEFLKSKTGQTWTFEKNNSGIEKIFGGQVKKLVNTDEKLRHFVSELTTSMGYENLEFSENTAVTKRSDHEIISEFQQNIGEVEIYGAYFRAFRDTDSLSANFFINEFKKYETVVDREAYNPGELAGKLEQYYERLGKTVNGQNCGQKVFYVGEKKTAELAYRCVVKTLAQLPETFEVIVSAGSADILFQKRISIFN